jgi:hypothetical protein
MKHNKITFFGKLVLELITILHFSGEAGMIGSQLNNGRNVSGYLN